jgi:hypothetical protein
MIRKIVLSVWELMAIVSIVGASSGYFVRLGEWLGLLSLIASFLCGSTTFWLLHSSIRVSVRVAATMVAGGFGASAVIVAATTPETSRVPFVIAGSMTGLAWGLFYARRSDKSDHQSEVSRADYLVVVVTGVSIGACVAIAVHFIPSLQIRASIGACIGLFAGLLVSLAMSLSRMRASCARDRSRGE